MLRKILILFLYLFLFSTCVYANTYKHQVTSIRIESFTVKFTLFKRDIGRYPTTEEGLNALLKKPDSIDSKFWNGPYIDRPSIPPDPWYNDYVYFQPAKFSSKEYDLYSFGKNGLDDHGLKDDITNWLPINNKYYSYDKKYLLFIGAIVFVLIVIFYIKKVS